MNIEFITSNPSKVKLAQERFDRYNITAIQRSLDLYEIQSLNVEEVALNKAKQALVILENEFIIEDSGFEIEALNNFPGALLKPIVESIGADKITLLLKEELNRNVLVKSVLVYGNPKTGEVKIFTGLYKGSIAIEARGEKTRGWKVTPIFIPDGFDHTLAEMEDIEWDKFLNSFRSNDHYEHFGQYFSSR